MYSQYKENQNKGLLNKIKKHYLLILIIIALAELSIKIAFNSFISFPDTQGYIETVKWLKNRSGEVFPLRIQRPLQIFFILLFEPILGITPAFILTNCIFYIASIPFFFSFSKKLLKDENLAFISTFLFISSFCVLYWGLAPLTDMLLWFLMSVGFDLLIDIKEKWKSTDIYKLSFIVGLGILNKESIISLSFLLIFLFFSRFIYRQRDKFKKIIRFLPPLIFMIIPFLITQLLMYVYFGSEYTFFSSRLKHKTEVQGQLWYLPITFIIGFNILIIFYLFGINSFIKNNSMFNKKEYLISLVLTLIPVVVFETYSPRLSFLIFPLVIPVAAVGLKNLLKHFQTKPVHYLILLSLILFLYCIFNNAASVYGDSFRAMLGIWSRLSK
jgi:hypothetical protein